MLGTDFAADAAFRFDIRNAVGMSCFSTSSGDTRPSNALQASNEASDAGFLASSACLT
eukprot:CAMPEP_0172764024 /NCGR_PEP_ID=MMETSP1074-20121228/176514_1 /TAXON_ID=2916 /ORGANISM="Ceratium fusus, Strain PA161109" /LENGTH=57 /DNA_ID=CAMNT_0013598717 /DNA_START=89 /DNA_END=262 /DNA_ORIENTATION=-